MAWPKALLKGIGRDQGPQLWFSSNFTPAGSGTVTVQQPQTADLSRLYGNNSRTGSTVPFFGSGASLFALDSMFDTSGVGGKQYLTNSVSAGVVRQPRLSSPMGLTIGTAVGEFGGVASYDIETHYSIPFGPFGGNPVQGMLFSQRDSD